MPKKPDKKTVRCCEITMENDGSTSRRDFERLETESEYLERLKQEARKKELEKLNKREKQIYDTLSSLIDSLYEDGVDVSYFPDSADDTLRSYAKTIAKI